MAEKATPAVTPNLTPPFAPRPIPPKPRTAAPLSASQTPLQNEPNPDPQPVFDTASNMPLTALDSLPTITGRGNSIVLANDSIAEFLATDLDLKRLNDIHAHLWMAGRPMRARPLHRYTMEGYDILFTQQMDLHLLKFSTKLMVKPLPEWILSSDFWTEHLCSREDLHKSACGFLLSYVWLVVTPLDLKLAHDNMLLPSFVTWRWWKAFVGEFYRNVDVNTLHQVNKRFQFGDLRLSRVNSIYRSFFFRTHFVRGYLYGYNRYVVFFQRNFSWILIVFVFFSLVLSAMQVGTGLDELKDNYAFLKASYVFVVFSMVSVVAVLAVVTVVFVGIFLFNMVTAISHARNTQRERKKLARERAATGKEA